MFTCVLTCPPDSPRIETPLVEALPYIRRFAGKTIVVYGDRAPSGA